MTDKACKIPMVAEELWIRNAAPVPTRKPSTGVSAMRIKRFAKVSDSDSGATAAVMLSSPVNRMPKPIATLPMMSDLLECRVMITRIPMIAATGARVEGLKIFSHEEASPSMSSRRMICPVTVVPTFAPRMMPMDCLSERIPAPTRPEVRTIVAVELWMIAVTRRPSKNPVSGLFATFSMNFLSAPEEPCCRPSPISRMP